MMDGVLTSICPGIADPTAFGCLRVENARDIAAGLCRHEPPRASSGVGGDSCGQRAFPRRTRWLSNGVGTRGVLSASTAVFHHGATRGNGARTGG